jgi:hypothetical protein
VEGEAARWFVLEEVAWGRGKSEKGVRDSDRCLLRRRGDMEQWGGGVRCTVDGRRGLGGSGAWQNRVAVVQDMGGRRGMGSGHAGRYEPVRKNSDVL